MTITITSPGEYVSTTKDVPITGRSYALDDLTTGTGAQNRTWHALLTVYWTSGAHSYDAKTFDEFRDQIKRSLGAGFESYAYAIISNGKAVLRVVKTWEEIPKGLRVDPDKRDMIRGRLKSWTDYSKRERTDAIDRLIAEMHQAGVNSERFIEILQGMEDKSK
jgi:hypothetical protein